MRLLIDLMRNVRAATAIEYGLIMALVFLGMIVGITNFGGAVIKLLNNVSSTVVNAG